MDATITDGSFATILSMGSAGMLMKSIDFDRFLEETSFLRPATADRNSSINEVIDRETKVTNRPSQLIG